MSTRRFPHVEHIGLFFKVPIMRLIVLLLTFFLAPALSAQSLNVKVRAKSAILYNPDNGAILFQKRAKEPHYPASILKIATALFILDQKSMDLQKMCVASKDALEVIHADKKQADPLSYPSYIIEHDGVIVGIEEGKEYSLEFLVHGLLLESGNDAANVIAEGVGGSIPKFMDDLNLYLQKKGIHQTRFQNPHGLHHPAQITTAYDMALIASLAFQNPTFCKIVLTPTYPFKEGKLLVNTNRLLKEGKYQYPKYIGGKTGYIARAGYNFVAAAEQNGRKLIAVLLGYENIREHFEDAINLFETAFREKEEKRLLFSKDHECFSRKNSKNEEILKAKLEQDVAVNYFPSEEPDLHAKLVWHKLKRPVLKGEVVGELVVENASGIELATAELFVDSALEKANFSHWWLRLLGFLLLGGSLAFYKKARKVLKR